MIPEKGKWYLIRHGEPHLPNGYHGPAFCCGECKGIGGEGFYDFLEDPDLSRFGCTGYPEKDIVCEYEAPK